MPAPRLFVSHSHLDNAFAKRLVADLQSRLGTEAVWMDELGGLHGGDDWWRKIVAEITAREVFLVVLSPQALASEWVLKEMGIAYFQYVKAGKKLRPILLEACTLTTDWELIHAINFTGGPAAYAAKLEELLGTLDLESGAKAPPPAAQRRPAVARLVQEVQVAFGLQDWRAVEDKTDALAQLAPDAFTAALWQERGLALLALDNPELALEALDRALSAEPDDVPTLQAKGTALLAVQRVEEAIQAFRLAYSLAPYDDIPLRLRALADLVEALMQAGKWAEAARRAEDGTRLAPGEPDWQQRLQAARLGPHEARLQAAYEAAKQGQRWDEALAACAEALRLAPDIASWQQRQAQIKAQQEAQQKAQADAARAEAERAAARQRLTDGSYLQEKLARQGVKAVLDELDQAEQDETLRALAAAIRAGTVVLGRAPEEVWNQARGRAGLTLHASRARQVPRFDLRFATLLPADEALVRVLEGHTGPVPGCAFSPDGTLALSASYDRTLRLWNVASGQTLRVLEGHTNWVRDCALSPDGTLALSASHDQTLRLWNVASGQTVRVLKGHTGSVLGCAFSPDGALALSASHDQTLRLWNVASGSEVCRWTTDAGLLCCAFGPEGVRVIAGGSVRGFHFLSLVTR